MAGRSATKKRVADLDQGEETAEHGVVAHREGRKVWFEQTIVTFPSEEDLVTVVHANDDRRP